MLLRGVGGIGKTHLVDLYVKEYDKNYTKIIRLDYKVSLSYTLIHELGEMIPEQIKVLNIEEQFSAIINELLDLSFSDKLLLVIDNAMSIEGVEWERLLRVPCHILITSREHSVFNYGKGIKEIEIGALDELACIQVFNFYYDSCNEDSSIVLDIIKEVNYLTLLIELAAKSAKAAGLTPAELLKCLKKKKLFIDIDEQIYDYKEKIYKKPTDMILNLFTLAELKQSEVLFLSFLSTLPYGQYRKSTILKWTWYENQDLINKLILKGWVQDNNIIITMHPIIADTIRLQTKPSFYKLNGFLNSIIRWANDDEIPQEVITNLPKIVLWFKSMCKISKMNVKYINDASRLIHLCAKYYLFLEGISLFDCISAIFEKNESYAEIFESMSELYISMGNYSQALIFLKQSKEIKQEIFGEFSKEMTGLYMKEAIIYRNIGRYQSSIFYYRKAIEIEQQQIVDYNKKLVIIYTYLARALLESNLISEALECSEKALKMIKNRNEDLVSAVVYNRFGFILAIAGRYNKGEYYLKKALDIRKEILGEYNPDTASTINNLGFLYYAWNKCGDAKKYFNLALNIRLKILGDMHSGTATTYNNLGRVFLKTKNFKSAMHYFLVALKIRRKIFGRENENTLYVYYNIGNIYENQTLFDRALFLYRYVYNIRKEFLGEDHVETIQVYEDMQRVSYQIYEEPL